METPKKVLLVDDELAILKVLRIKLKISGFEVFTAARGQEALDLVASEKPDIVLLDVIMPEMDGFEVLERLRRFSQVPVIVFSARPENARKALELGANGFLPKPFDVEYLVKKIKSLLNHG